jgi:D-glycero-D-manno-heptose 1,7-bisphosphate phosphatase
MSDTGLKGAIIFDRDGVLNADTGYPHRPEHIVWIDGAMEAVRAVNEAGLLAFVATNQSGIARGMYAEADLIALHDWMNTQLARAGARIDAFAFSPYHPEATVEAYRRDSDCRKPGPRMLLDLMAAHPVDRKRTAMVGDRISDMQAAKAAGIEGLLFKGGNLAQAIAPLIAKLTA